MPPKLSSAFAATLIEAAAARLDGGAMILHEATGTEPLAIVRIASAVFTAPDRIALTFQPGGGLRKGNAARFQVEDLIGTALFSEMQAAGKPGSGAALELKRTAVEPGSPVRITEATLRWPAGA